MKIKAVKEVKIDQTYADNIKEDLELMVNAVNGSYGIVTFLRITESANVLREALEKQLNPDLVEVVRCKDCKSFHKENNGKKWCGRFDGGIGSDENDYCSHGER